MARIFGQLAAQPVDIYRMLDGDSKFTAFATSTLERPGATTIGPALTYAENRVNYSLGDITDGIEIVVLSDELRQDDILLDLLVHKLLVFFLEELRIIQILQCQPLWNLMMVRHGQKFQM